MSTRRSRRVPSKNETWAWSSGEASLLYRDFYNHIVPPRDTYQLSAEGAPAHQVAKSFLLNPYRPPVDSFIQGIGSTLLRRYEAWIEVVYESWEGNDGLFSVFEVDGVKQTESGDLIQDVPSRDQLRDWDGTQDDWTSPIELDADRMIHVSLPDEYPSEVLSRVAGHLSRIEPITTRPWFLEGMRGERPNIVSFEEATLAERLCTLQTSLPLGWAAREQLGPDARITDYYYLWRELRFLHFRALMRERAEGALRKIVALASEQYDFSAEVWSEGIYTHQQVSERISQFEAGKVNFDTVFDILYGKETGSDLNRRRVV